MFNMLLLLNIIIIITQYLQFTHVKTENDLSLVPLIYRYTIL